MWHAMMDDYDIDPILLCPEPDPVEAQFAEPDYEDMVWAMENL